MAEELVTRISLEGADQVNSQLTNVGKSGEESFGKLAEAVGRLDAVTSNFNRRMVQTHGRLHESAEGIGESFKELTETVGGAAEALGSHFGEGGEVLGKVADKILGVVGDIGLAFSALPKSAKAGVEGAAHEVGKLGEAGEEATSGLSTTFAGLTRIAGPIAAVLATVGAALGAAGYFAVESAEKFEHLKNSIAGISFDEFRGLAAVAQDAGVPLQQMAETTANVNEQFHQAAIEAPLLADRLQFITDRVQVMRQRMTIGAEEHRLAEEKASDQVADSYHNIEKSQQSALDAQQHYTEAVETYQRHGRPLTHMEQQEKEEKQRLQGMLSAERAVKEAQRSADEAVHKHTDMLAQQQVQAASRNLQMQQEHTMLERVTNMQNRQTAMAIEGASPVERLFLEHNKLAKGFGDTAADTQKNFDMLGKEMVSFVGKAPTDKLRTFVKMLLEMREHITKMPEGEGKSAAQEIEDRIYLQGRIPDTFRRNLQQIAGELGKPGATPEERTANTERLAKRADELHIMREDQMEGLLKAHDTFQRALDGASNAAIRFGESVALAGQKVAKALGAKSPEEEKEEKEDRELKDTQRADARRRGWRPARAPAEPIGQEMKDREKAEKEAREAALAAAHKAAREEGIRESALRVGRGYRPLTHEQEKHEADKESADSMKDAAHDLKSAAKAINEKVVKPEVDKEEEDKRRKESNEKAVAAMGVEQQNTSATGANTSAITENTNAIRSMIGGGSRMAGAAEVGGAGGAGYLDEYFARRSEANAGAAAETAASDEQRRAAGLPLIRGAGLSPRDEVVGVDRHGREILASGAKRLSGTSHRWNVRQNPFFKPSEEELEKREGEDDNKAGGGLVRGHGSGTSDSNLIRASKGEYVVKADGSNLGEAIDHFTKGFAGGGIVNSFAMSVRGYAGGGKVVSSSPAGNDPLSYHALDITTDKGSFRAHVTPDVMEAIQGSALAARLSRTGERPSWFS